MIFNLPNLWIECYVRMCFSSLTLNIWSCECSVLFVAFFHVQGKTANLPNCLFSWGSVLIVMFIVSWLEQTLLQQGCSSLLLRLFSDLHLTLNMFLWFCIKNITYMTDCMFCRGSVSIVLFIVSWLWSWTF